MIDRDSVGVSWLTHHYLRVHALCSTLPPAKTRNGPDGIIGDELPSYLTAHDEIDPPPVAPSTTDSCTKFVVASGGDDMSNEIAKPCDTRGLGMSVDEAIETLLAAKRGADSTHASSNSSRRAPSMLDASCDGPELLG